MHLLRSAVVATAMLACGLSARAADTALHPVQDVFVASNGEIGGVLNLGISNRGPEFIRRTFLQFDLSTIPAGANIEKAVLRLVPNSYVGAEGGAIPLALWGFTENVGWHEDNITWANAPKRDVALEEGLGEAGLERLASQSWDGSIDVTQRPQLLVTSEELTAYVRRFAGKPVTLLLVSEGGAKTPGLIFFSKDNRPVARAVYPALIVTTK